MSVSRTNTSKKDAVSSILVPFNLSLLAKRNLSASWYRGIPTIDLTANLDTLKVRNMLGGRRGREGGGGGREEGGGREGGGRRGGGGREEGGREG